MRREVFFQKLWDRTGTFVEDNTLTVTVSRLKTKLGKMDNSDKNYIDTIREWDTDERAIKKEIYVYTIGMFLANCGSSISYHNIL